MIGALHGPWLLGAALLLVIVAVWREDRPGVRALSLVGAITVGAGLARLVWGLWGPLHINGQGPLWIRGALDSSVLVMSYGPGYFESLNWVTPLAQSPDRAVFAANLLLSALSPALLYATARLAGITPGASLAAALVLAADAVLIRTAASEGYFSVLIALVLGTYGSVALAVRAEQRRDRAGAAVALGAAALLATAAARTHPMGYLPLALCPLVAAGTGSSDTWRTRVMRAALVAGVVGSVVLLTSGTTMLRALRASAMTQQALAGIGPQRGALLLGCLLAGAWFLRRCDAAWLGLLGLFSMAVLVATQDSFRQHPIWTEVYRRLFWPGVLLGAGALLPRRMQRVGWALGMATVVSAVSFAEAWPALGTPTTKQIEYRFLRDVLRDMPPDCTLASVSHTGKRVWEIPSYFMPRRAQTTTGAERAVESAADLNAGIVPGNCLVYVRASLCTSLEARGRCEAIEREARLEPVARDRFPAVPSFTDLPYDRSEVEVVVFRVSGPEDITISRRASVSDGAPITPDLAQALFKRIANLREPDGCRPAQFDTGRFRITVKLQDRGGAVRVMEMATAPDHSGWALAVPPELERECGSTIAAIERALMATE